MWVKLFVYKNKFSLLFWSLIESPGNLTKDDIADDSLKVISGAISSFIVRI